jgi:hypothetical protein
MPWVITGGPPSSVPTGGSALSGPPQFDAPFRLDTSGHPVMVEQDSSEEIGAAVYNIVICPQGAKLNDPTFGTPSPLFGNAPLDTTAIIKAVQAREPRANATAVQETIRVVQAAQPVRLDVVAHVSAG